MFRSANLLIRFLLELSALAALGYWGFHSGQHIFVKIVLGLGAPLLAAIVWGAFVAPRAPLQVSGAMKLIPELAVFGLAAAGLFLAGQPLWAIVFAVLAIGNSVILKMTDSI